MNTTQTVGAPLPGPFKGQSMTCRACHLVDELAGVKGGGVRTYADFARRSPIPVRDDGLTVTPRNAPPMVNATLMRDVPAVFHSDGEFASIGDLVVGTLTGRNFGWLPAEQNTAISHIANVIRSDNGKNALAQEYGGGGVPYQVLLAGTSAAIPAHLVIPAQYRFDVTTATDPQVLNGMAKLIQAYLDSLRFSTDSSGQYNGSPYDVFLAKNGLPRAPFSNESGLQYSQRLLGLINQLSNPKFVTSKDGKFTLHNQAFAFGATELQGLKIFFSTQTGSNSGHTGNCVSCHTPPNFTDFVFHNNGTSQFEYDAIFGNGAFANLDVPDLQTRNGNFDAYLPPSPEHPNATSRMRSPATADKPGYTDLGAWNIVGNPDLPNAQPPLTQILCGEFDLDSSNCTPDVLLPLTVAYFKTPTVRDLGQSDPYLHNGSMDSIEDVLNFYVESTALSHDGQLRNGSPELSNVQIDSTDVAPLAAFLRALNEDYD